MAHSRKRFQTGREIMKEYVPNYVPPTRTFEAQQHLGVRSGNELAQALLREFERQLGKKKLSVKPQGAASNKAMQTDAASPRR